MENWRGKRHKYTDKKGKSNSPHIHYKEIQNGADAKSCMTNGLLIYWEYLRISSYIRKPFLIYDFATAPLWISLYVYEENFINFIFFVSYRRLSPQFQFSLSAVILGIYVGVCKILCCCLQCVYFLDNWPLLFSDYRWSQGSSHLSLPASLTASSPHPSPSQCCHLYASFFGWLYLKVPKWEIFDPFFYTNKFYLGWRLEDWKFFKIVLKTTADIRHFVFFVHAECALKNCLRMRACAKNAYACWACAKNC